MSEIIISFQKLSEKAKTPSQATFSDAGYDLFATEAYILKPGERKLFKTNISAAIPHGYYGRIAPRS
jgi:dUTP pyrophosphatase